MTTQRIRALLAAFAIALAALLITVVSAGPAVARGRDTIALVVAKPVKIHKRYDITISGFAGKHAEAYLFVDYSRCSASFAVEKSRAVGEGLKYAVKGEFGRTSVWTASLVGSDHACAYLVILPSRRVLAAASATFAVH
jgi:hypothetical protein